MIFFISFRVSYFTKVRIFHAMLKHTVAPTNFPRQYIGQGTSAPPACHYCTFPARNLMENGYIYAIKTQRGHD